MQIKTITLTLTFLATFLNATFAQKLTVEDMNTAPMDLSASQYERKDLAGQSCGLIKVQLATTGAEFEGNIVGQTEYKTGEYWVYMTEGAYMLTVKLSGVLPLDINFRDYGIMGVTGKSTYKLTLLMPESKEKATQQFTIRYTPKDAIVIIDSNPYQGSDGVVTATLPIGQHDYLVTATGYAPIDGSIRLKVSTPSTIRIDLEKTKDNTPSNPIQLSATDNAAVTTKQHSATVSTASMKANIETFTVNGVSFNMVRVEGGTFTMGATPEQGKDAWDSEKPAHQVTLSTYSIGETEVTQALWQAVMGNNPSKFKGSNLPVEQVSWDDCQEFIQKLNRLTSKRFRLPTEAEWEFAARGGSKSRGYKYSGSNNIGKVAWYYNTTGGKGTKDVKTKKANELGLYDMSGNVWEWCQDWHANYKSDSQTNPIGPTSESHRVVRSGCWDLVARCCRVSYRNGVMPDSSVLDIGLRLAQ